LPPTGPPLPREFITLLVVIDPVGTIPVYLFAVASMPRHLHRQFPDLLMFQTMSLECKYLM